MSRDAIEATVIAATNKVTAAGSVTTLFGWLTTNEALGLMGLIVGVVGLLINVHYRWKQDRREQKADDRAEIEHRRRMDLMQSKPGELP